MTLSSDLEVDCCEEELSEAQVSFFSNAMMEYEKAMSEANQIKKGKLYIKLESTSYLSSVFVRRFVSHQNWKCLVGEVYLSG